MAVAPSGEGETSAGARSLPVGAPAVLKKSATIETERTLESSPVLSPDRRPVTLCLGPRARPSEAPSPADRNEFRHGHARATPAPTLAAYVDHYWITRWDRRDHPARTASALLDPCVHLQIHDDRAEIMGVVRGAFRVRLEGAGYVIGVRFRPGGFHPFVRQPIAQWTDRTAPAGEVLGATADDAARALRCAVAECRGDADAHAALIKAHLDALLGARLTADDPLAEEMASLVASIAKRADVRRVRDLARASGRSERTLERLFMRYVGVSPAWVIRRCRLRVAAERLTACPGADVRALAYELGYADQAHFIRDFRATIGVTPGAYVGARA